MSGPLGVVVVNYNSTALLEDLRRQTVLPRDAVVVVVDNSDAQAERDACRALVEATGWHLITSTTNVGFGAAANAGARWCIERSAERILLLNPDAMIDEPGLSGLLGIADVQPRAMISPVILRADGGVWFSGAYLRPWTAAVGHRTEPDPTIGEDWLTAACLLVPAAAWTEGDGFPEEYFVYWEDVEFTYRWRQREAIVVEHSVRALHSVGGTQEGSGKSLVYLRYNVRNRLLFASRNLRAVQLALWIVATPVFVAQRLRWAERSLGIVGPLRAVGEGLVEGVRLIPAGRREYRRYLRAASA